ncbi:MAG TPA: hypothetical protein VG711_10070 [Phycisphaerales bacterium]|nr:hypothetical protein [Phycisphaerales bacterium]
MNETGTNPQTQNESSPAHPRQHSLAKSVNLPLLVSVAVLCLVVGFLIHLALGSSSPKIETITEREKANFQAIHTALDSLGQSTSSSPEAFKLHKQLVSLIAEQEKLAARTGADLQFDEAEVTRLKSEMLQDRGTVTGADFWLAPNESITLHDRDTVLALLGIRGNGALADINFAGKPQTLKPGNAIDFQSGSAKCKLIYKVATPRADGRIGFDLVVSQ